MTLKRDFCAINRSGDVVATFDTAKACRAHCEERVWLRPVVRTLSFRALPMVDERGRFSYAEARG